MARIGMKSYHLCFLPIDLLCNSLLVSHLSDYFMVEIQSYQLKMLYPAQWIVHAQIDLSYYKTEVSSNLTEAWKLAQERIKKA